MLAAIRQDWTPFVLVAGLLLVGLAAERDSLFAAAGSRLARAAPNGVVLYVGAVALISVVTAVLNLDTSVAFLTPVLVHTARARGEGEAPLLYGAILLSNAASLLLPGSNLTNLIVLGHLDLTGSEFVQHMAAPFGAAVVVTAAGVAIHHRADLAARTKRETPPRSAHVGLGLAGLLAVVALVLVVPEPALPVLAVGVLVTAVRLAQRRETWRAALAAVGPLSLAALFAVAVAAGTIGRSWHGPAHLLSSLGAWGTAAVGAVASVLVNNLPASSLLSAQPPTHPYALLIGLNVGPNLFVTGSLAWLLWWRSARAAGSRPSLRHAVRLGLTTAPLAMAASIGVLVLQGG